MPHDKDGNPVDIVLNPLGVPSRMNVGQILEVHLGLPPRASASRSATCCAANATSRKFADSSSRSTNDQGKPENLNELTTPNHRTWPAICRRRAVPRRRCSTVPRKEIKAMLRLAGMPESGQMVLFDGRTGEQYERPVTVGYMHFLKLHHLVDDKMHARSTGPYSLVTQQPLGGKAQFGGQRFGEMEVWALEAYGAPTCCRKCSPSSPTTLMAVPRSTKTSSGRAQDRCRHAGVVQRSGQGNRSLAIDIDLERY